MFIKHSDGKIVSVLETEELTEEQKEAVEKMNDKQVKTSEEQSHSNINKNLGAK